MINKSQVLFAVFLLIGASAFARGPYLEVGHREAMMAGGGSTNICSPGQFMLNPAGLVCENKNDLSESFGSTNFSTSRTQFEQGGQLNDLTGTQYQTRPGLSIFSQSGHSLNTAYGAWGSVNQFSVDKAAMISGNLSGSLEFSQSSSEFYLGGFYAKKLESFSWGGTISFGQKEYRNIQNFKYRAATDYITRYSDTLAVEKFLSVQLGVLRQSGPMVYAFSIRPPTYSLGGKVFSNVTETGTDNRFTETNQSASIRSSAPWRLTGGSEYSWNETDKVAVDLNWTSASRSDLGGLQGADEDAPTWALIVSSKIQLNQKTTFISGFRWLQTTHELTSQSRFAIPLISAGILRTFRGVELGTGIAYSKGDSEVFNQDVQRWQKTGSLERLDFTFSSSFTY